MWLLTFLFFLGKVLYIILFWSGYQNSKKPPDLLCRRLGPGEFWRSGLAERSRYAGGWWLEGERNLAGAARWCPSSLAKLVQISPISLWFMADTTIVFMGFINPQTSLGGTILWDVDGCCVWLSLNLLGKNFQSHRNGELFLKCLVVSSINGLLFISYMGCHPPLTKSMIFQGIFHG